MKRATIAVLTALVAALLVACGGGGCNPCDTDAPTPHVDCKAHPEQCK